MLKGDLTSTPLAPLLLELGNDAATGCLHINDSAGEEALVYLKAGLVNSISVPGARPQLGAKLVSSGALAPEALAEALEAQRTELQGWRLGELLVHLGYVELPVVEAFVKEQVCDALWDLLRWPEGSWKFRKNITAREDVAPPTAVVELLEQLRARGYEWEVISQVVHGPAAVPTLSAVGEPNTETTLDNDAWSMLCKIDGERSVADLARDCGYTLFEAGHIIVSLVQAGLVDIDENVDLAGQEPYGASTLMSALVGAFEDPAAVGDETNPAASDDPAADPADRDAATPTASKPTQVAVGPAQRPGATYENPTIVHRYPHATESFATSIDLVSSALAGVLGEAPATETQPVSRRVAPRRPTAEVTDDAEWERRKRHRTAAAAELASAQALIETLRAENPVPAQSLGTPSPSLRQPEAEPEAVVAAGTSDDAEAAARSAAEQFARAAAEEAERDAAAQAAQRRADEQAAQAAELEAAETQAWQEYEQREAAERQAAEAAAAARLAAETAEAERLAAEAAERLAAEAAEAERLAAEEAERVAAQEAANQAAAEEAQRQAAEAERIAAEAAEAERLAAEEAERLAAEAAERAAAEAAEAEAERLAAEAAERAAAEAAERAATEAAEREATEAAEREATEAAEREAVVAAAAEAAELAAAEAASEQAAAEEAALQADEAAAASALLIELANDTAANGAAGDDQATDDDAEADPQSSGSDDSERDDADDDREAASSASWRDPETTDTAALLRELSSLGADDDAGAAGAAPRAARPAAADKKVKKKIGLFGL